MENQQPIQLYYWGIRGLAQRIRLILEYIGLKYDNIVYSDQGQWFNNVKPNLSNSFANLPYLKDGDNIVCESEAIIVYVILKANRGELLGRDNQQRVDIAQVRGAFGDFTASFYRLVYGQDFATNKPAFLQQAKIHLKKFSSFLGTKNYICGQITYVDFLLAQFFNVMNLLDKTLLEGFPNLQALNDKIWNQQKIKQYVASGRFKLTPLNGSQAKWQGE